MSEQHQHEHHHTLDVNLVIKSDCRDTDDETKTLLLSVLAQSEAITKRLEKVAKALRLLDAKQ